MNTNIDEEKKSVEQSSHNELSDVDLAWSDLAQDWQSQPYQKTDIKKLIKQTKRRIIGAKFCLALDVLGTLAVVIAFICGLIAGDWQTATLYYFGFGSLFSLIFCLHTIKFRLLSWRQISDAPDKAISNAIINCQASIQYARLSKLACYLLFPAVNWYLFEITTTTEKSLLPSLIFINIFVATVWGISHYFLCKRRNELIQLKGFLGE